MRNSTLKPDQMRNTPSPTSAWIRDGVSSRPAPVGISASPTASRVKTSAPARQVPAGYQAHPPSNQKKSIIPVTFSTASLRPNPVGDSGSPRLSRTGHAAFPRPSPIGHSASPLLPRGKSSPPEVADTTKNDVSSITNPASAKQTKKRIGRQDVIGNASLQRQRSVTKNRSAADVKIGSTGFNLTAKDLSHRPTPVGNASTSNTPSGSVPSQKSFLMKYTIPTRLPVTKNALTMHASALKPISPACLDVAQDVHEKNIANITDNCESKRPSPMGMSPSSTLKKSFVGKTASIIPSPRKAVSGLPTPKTKVGDTALSHQGPLETTAKPKIKPAGWVPRTKCIGISATQKVKVAKNDLSPQPIEAEQCPAERTKAKGSKFSLKQKPAEKYGLSIQKSTGSITFQRPKQTGNTGSQTAKCRNVVSSTKNSQQSVTVSRPLGNTEVARPANTSTISLSKVIKKTPSARAKQNDTIANTVSPRPQTLGNKLIPSKSKSSPNYEKPTESITRTPPKKLASQLLPRLPFMQKKSPKITIMKSPVSRAEENSYMVCSPGWKVSPNVKVEENDVTDPVQDLPPLEDSLDLHNTFSDNWDTTLTEESLEAALRANAAIFRPIQDEHLVLVRPRLLGSHISDEYLEQKYWLSKAKDGK